MVGQAASASHRGPERSADSSERIRHHLVLGTVVREVSADPGVMIVAYSAEPGSRSAEAFGLLASWAATEEGSHLALRDAAAHEAERDAR